jgi:NAD(P)-dependent dehydrogenase (short-subunit alcohol dehydrogenase family)
MGRQVMNDFHGKNVLVTGGTKGIGLATGLAFGQRGARVVLTHRWGTASEDDVRAAFDKLGAPPPLICEADVSHHEDTVALLERIGRELGPLDVFVSNASMALVVKGLDDYDKRALFRSIEYSAWPLYEYTKEAKRILGRYPRYVIGLSSGGPDHFYKNYDFVASSKAVLETLCRYMSYRLAKENVRVNVVRSRLVSTESLRATFGSDFEEFVKKFNMAHQFITPEEVANTIVALSSGLMDGVSGQVLMVDRGTTFSDNLMRLYEERDDLEL